MNPQPWLIGDKAYDSDPLDVALKEQNDIELTAPNRRGSKRKKGGPQAAPLS